MPFLKEIIINKKTKIKLWKVDIGEIDKSNLNKHDKNILDLKKDNLYKEQFLAVRKLIELEDSDYTIRYDKLGKPSINSNLNISISHSSQIAAIVFSNNKRIGLDVQLIESKIINIQDKFLNISEKKKIGKNLTMDLLTMIWSSKESIFKAISKKGIGLSQNIIIDQVVEKAKNGKGYYINGNQKIRFHLEFFYLNKYIICYASEI